MEIYPFFIILAIYLLGYISLVNILLLYIAFCLYTYFKADTELIYNKESKVINEIVSKMEKHKYKPNIFFPACILQTLVHPLISFPDIFKFRREKINDFGTNLDWVESTKDIPRKRKSFNNKRILFILPGLTGSATDPYISNICYEAIVNNYTPIVYQYRLLSDTLKFKDEGFYCLTEDIDEAITYLENKCPVYDIYAVGHSYGANNIINFLAKRNCKKVNGKKQKRIQAAASVACGFNFAYIENKIRDGLYCQILTSLLQNQLKESFIKNNVKVPKHMDLNVEKALTVTRFRDFDDCITSKTMGYKNVDDYYYEVGSYKNVHKVSIPLLCLNARDDAIALHSAIPIDDCINNKNVLLMMTTYGGHISWIDNQSLFALKQWHPKVVMDFLNNA